MVTATLFKQKDDSAFVGLRLWWLGFPVANQYWLPAMLSAAEWLDRVFYIIPKFRERFDRHEKSLTLQEALASNGISNIVLSRVKGRLSHSEMEVFYRVGLDVMTGDYTSFGPDELKSSFDHDDVKVFAEDKKSFLTGLDINAAKNHHILGTKIGLDKAMQSILRDLGSVVQKRGFAKAVAGSHQNLFEARDDIRRTLITGWALYEALKWIYGPEAFGLRLIAWIATKAPDTALPALVLLFSQLREIPGVLHSSESIRQFALQAEDLRQRSKAHRYLFEHEPKWRAVFNPKRMREAFIDDVSLKKWQHEVDLISGKTT